MPSPTPEPAVQLPLDNLGVPIISPVQATDKAFTQDWRVGLDGTGQLLMAGEADGIVFVKNWEGALFALDAKTGATVWKLPAPPSAGTQPIAPALVITGPGIVAVGDLLAEKISGYDPKTGQKKWDVDLKFSAPNRDTGSRFLGGKVYDGTLTVVVSSKHNPYDAQTQTANPEYLSASGIDIKTGKMIWSALTDAVTSSSIGVRQGGVIFGNKNIYIESPDFSIGAIEGATGTRLWLILDTVLLYNDNPDLLYSILPEAGSEHNPLLRKNDPLTGNVIWQKELPVTVTTDPLIVVSPDEKTAYMSAYTSATESTLYGIDLDANTGLWSFKTTSFGQYNLTATGEGVRLRSFGNRAGVALFPRDKPIPATYALGPILFGDEISEPEGLYLTATDERTPGLIYLVNPATGNVLYAAKTEAISGGPLLGESQIYLATADATGKTFIYAFARPKA